MVVVGGGEEDEGVDCYVNYFGGGGGGFGCHGCLVCGVSLGQLVVRSVRVFFGAKIFHGDNFSREN